MGDEQVRGEKADVSTPRLATHGCEIESKCHQRTVSRKGLKMASLNINGLRSHLDEIKVLMHDMKIDILALNETKLDSSIDQQITHISGYSQQRLDRSRFGGGISIYVRNTITFIHRKDVPLEDLELLCIEVQPPKCRPFLVLTWYRPPNSPVAIFSKAEKVLSYLDKEGKEMILMGDTNCDLSQEIACLSLSENSRHISNLYDLFSLKQIINEPTRVTLTTSTLIDHISTSCIDNILESGVHKVSMSDHYMVFCKRKINAGLGGHKMVVTRNMKLFNESAFLADISSIDWELVVNKTDDVNVMVEKWSSLFSAVIEKHAPTREMRVSDRNSPWINTEIKLLMKSRDKLKKAAVKNKSSSLMEDYRKVRNRVNSLNILLKQQYFMDKISENKGNMKECWKITSKLLNKCSKSTNITYIKDGDIEIREKREISNTMNNYFCSVGEDLANNVEKSSNPLLTGKYTVNQTAVCFEFKEVECTHIRDAICKMKTSKGSGNDNISSYFLKISLPFITKSLCCIFNKSILKCVFPAQWKIARVTPIFKEGDKNAKSNYRPISVLPVISRLFEKLVYNQLYEYMSTNGLIASCQSGFRAHHSTTTALLKCTDDWLNGIDAGKYAGVVFVDLKKAFDTVDHGILLQKLAHYGVQGHELEWFKSYLSKRTQFTRVNGCDSRVQSISLGVPQGSCLGPLLFSIYINDLPMVIDNAKVYMYADDTCISFQADSVAKLNEGLNKDLEALDSWLSGNILSLNVAKTQSMTISTKHKQAALEKKNEQLCLQMRNETLGAVQNAKYLGVHIDNSLDWKKHIQETSKKISRSLGMLKYAKRYLPFHALKNLYTSVIDPSFRYCCSVWGVCGAAEIHQLQKLQNRAARIITGSNYDAPSKPLIESLGWKTINDMIQFESRVMVFKSLNRLTPQYLSDLFVANSTNPSYNLRSTDTDLTLPKRNTSM